MRDLIFWIAWMGLCVALIFVSFTNEPVYTYLQEAEKWARERCEGTSGVRELRFHDRRQITLTCGDEAVHFWDRSGGLDNVRD